MATKVWTGTVSGNFGTAGNWAGGVAPANSDTLYIAGTVAITAGLSTGLTGINLIVDPTYTGTIGTSAGYLVIGCASFTFAGVGVSYIDLDSSNIAAIVTATATPGSTGTYGLYLKGSNLASLSVSGGYVALAGLDGETSTVATARVSGQGANVLLNTGVTLTTASVSSGNLIVGCAATTVTVNSGTCTTQGSGAITTIALVGGTLYPYSSGTVTTLTITGGTASFIGYPVARTVTNLKLNPGGTLVHDPAVLTITNKTNPDYPIRVSATAA
jgi:hypothetical protein